MYLVKKSIVKAGNNFYCDYIFTEEKKIITFDTKKVYFGLIFQTINLAKTHQSEISSFTNFPDVTPRDPYHFGLSIMIGNSYHASHYHL